MVHLENYTSIKDSISNLTKSRVLAYYQTIYETEKRDLTIRAQESEIELLDTRNRIKSQYLLLGGIGLLAAFGFFTIIRSRNHSRKQKLAQEKFTQDIINAQEAERSRVAFDLHDGVGQELVLLSQNAKMKSDTETQDLANRALQNLRAVSKDLHPVALENLGFTAALGELIHEFDSKSDIFCSSEIDDVDDLLDKAKALHLFRISQEVLSKYNQACRG